MISPELIDKLGLTGKKEFLKNISYRPAAHKKKLYVGSTHFRAYDGWRLYEVANPGGM